MGFIIKCVGRSQSQDEGGELMDMVEDWMGVLYSIFNPELPLVMNAPIYAPSSLKNTYPHANPPSLQACPHLAGEVRMQLLLPGVPLLPKSFFSWSSGNETCRAI